MRNGSNGSYTIIADPYGLALLIAGVIFGSVICVVVILLIVVHYIRTGENQGILQASLLFGGLAAFNLGVFGLGAKQLCVRITFEPETIHIRPLFGKEQRQPYKYYQYVYKGAYWHGSPIGIGMWKEYIVFSHGRIKDEDLKHINQFGKATDVIRIRYRKKTYSKLLAALPHEAAYKVKLCFPPEK